MTKDELKWKLGNWHQVGCTRYDLDCTCEEARKQLLSQVVLKSEVEEWVKKKRPPFEKAYTGQGDTSHFAFGVLTTLFDLLEWIKGQ